MNKERYNQIIDEVYENYEKSYEMGKHLEGTGLLWMSKETKGTFIYRSKTDFDFSQKWGLTIEERVLTDKERLNTLIQNEQRLIYEKAQSFKNLKRKTIKDYLDEKNIPTRLITLTHNNEKIESYE